MKKKEKNFYKQFGLVGRHISYSFSPSYFAKKFKNLHLNATYDTFDIESIDEIAEIFQIENLHGLNVTIPYKEEIIPYIDELSPAAEKIGAVNTIQLRNGKKIGHNTDYIGFLNSIQPLLQQHHQQALILGTGGANKAVQYALSAMGISYHTVSRESSKGDYTYQDLNKEIIENHFIIINTTPLGTHPNIHQIPPIPTKYLNPKHLVYDLIYNPSQTQLLKVSKSQGATIKNGLQMLEEQADASWEIWNNTKT